MNFRMKNVEDKIKQVIDKWNVTQQNGGGANNIVPAIPTSETEE